MLSSTVKRIFSPAKRVQIIASLAIVAFVLILGTLVLATRPHSVTASPQVTTSSGIPDRRDEHPKQQWQVAQNQSQSPACTPVATNGRGYVPMTGAGC